MTGRLNRPIAVETLCRQLGLKQVGPAAEILELCALEALEAGRMSFVLRKKVPPAGCPRGIVFGSAELADAGLTVIATANARLDFIRAQHLLARDPGFAPWTEPPQIHHTATIGKNVAIEPGVVIGEGTRVGHNVVIHGGTRIGRFCDIKSGAVIGEAGFGFERDEEGLPLKMLHLGGVRIGDHVEVGSFSTVCRGGLGDTVLEDHVKLDDHVHVAHNCQVGTGTLITACAELSGSVTVGKNVWIAPNATVVQKISIGDEAFIGMAAVVLKPVPARTKVFGNPARRISSDAPSAVPVPVIKPPSAA